MRINVYNNTHVYQPDFICNYPVKTYFSLPQAVLIG